MLVTTLVIGKVDPPSPSPLASRVNERDQRIKAFLTVGSSKNRSNSNIVIRPVLLVLGQLHQLASINELDHGSRWFSGLKTPQLHHYCGVLPSSTVVVGSLCNLDPKQVESLRTS